MPGKEYNRAVREEESGLNLNTVYAGSKQTERFEWLYKPRSFA